MRSQPHRGGMCVCACVCACSLPVQYMDECEHYMCQQTGDSTAFINKNKKSLAPVVQKWGSKRGAGKNGRDRFHRQAWVFNTDTVVSFLYHSLSPFLAPWQSQQRAHTPVYAEVSQIIMKLRSQRGFPCVAANLSVCVSECVCSYTLWKYVPLNIMSPEVRSNILECLVAIQTLSLRLHLSVHCWKFFYKAA